jgi:prevent-host-death family protein
MKSVGIRELKTRLSEYLRRVRSGETVLITDRGKVAAELLPPGQGQTDPSATAGLRDLAKRGLATVGTAGERDRYPALPLARRECRCSAAQLLDDERGPPWISTPSRALSVDPYR